MSFSSTLAMPVGHVAVVSAIVDNRRVLIDHANWSAPGMIEDDVLVQDVSAAGDWSAVRVWYGPIAALGARSNPVNGFIYRDPVSASDAGPVLAIHDRAHLTDSAVLQPVR